MLLLLFLCCGGGAVVDFVVVFVVDVIVATGFKVNWFLRSTTGENEDSKL